MDINKMLEHIIIDKISDDSKVILIVQENDTIDFAMQNIDNYKELDEIMCGTFNRYIGDKE
jgi:hypothetical protein